MTPDRPRTDGATIGLDRHFIAPFVLGMAGMSSYLLIGHVVSTGEIIELLPSVRILDRFEAIAGLATPAVALPVVDPLGDPLEHVGAVAHDMDPRPPLESLEPFDHRLQFHLIIGRLAF